MLLEISNLRCYFFTYSGVVKAVDNVSYDIEKGETFGLVGETGCGKSVTAYSIMRLIQYPPGVIVSGKVLFKNENLLEDIDKEVRIIKTNRGFHVKFRRKLVRRNETRMRNIRGREISMIFQEPTVALNPVYTVGEQIAETILFHQIKKERLVDSIPLIGDYVDRKEKKMAYEKSIEMLKLVNIPDAEKVVHEYPHELSGGMQQRVMIAMALACKPALLIADEPTTSLDVTIQAQILDLMRDLKKKVGTSILLITHDLGVIAEMCDRVGVMYAGKIVEIGTVKDIFEDTLHPYTKGLLRAIPKVGQKDVKLRIIGGTVPDLINPPQGCRFHPRCEFATEICTRKPPAVVGANHRVACFLYHNKIENASSYKGL